MNILHNQFLDPPEEFTPIPFWFWNDHLTKKEIIGQINDFHNKGVTGFVIHPRIGIPKEIEYLSVNYMKMVLTAVEEANRLEMSVVLYDEAMYPSGSAKGLVVKNNPEYASRGLKMFEYPYKESTDLDIELNSEESVVSVQAVKKLSANTIDLSTSQVLKMEDGRVSFTPPDDGNWSILVFFETLSGGHIRGIHFDEDDGEKNAPPSADLLNPKAVAKFIEITHKTYYEWLKNYFGNTVFAMFTDEPDILGRGSDLELKPWSGNLLSYYKQQGNEEVHLACLWFDAGEITSTIRRAYQKTINKRLSESYYKQISDWCEKHGIALTGHPARSGDIGLLDYFQIPGQDVVWRWIAPEDGKSLQGEHSTAGKCSADAARHRGRRRNLNEFLGVCSKESPWALSPGDMKWYIDWLLVRGVNLLCPHAFYYSIRGEKRSHERPPDVGPNNLWWPYYSLFAQYMKRLSWLMTDSTNQATIAILCEEDFLPWEVAKILYENQVEFNYLEEELFLSSAYIDDGNIKIERQSYETIIIERGGLQLDSVTIGKLEEFIQNGGEVIFLSDEYELNTINGAKQIENVGDVLKILSTDHLEEVVISPSSNDIRVSKIKKQDKLFYFFVNEGEENYKGSLLLKEQGSVEKWDAWNGTIKKISLKCQDNHIVVPLTIERRSSIVLAIDTEIQPVMKEVLKTSYKSEKIDIQRNWLIDGRPNYQLESWIRWDGMESFSGTVVYESQFCVRKLASISKVYLDLGEVYEIVRVTINGCEIGVKMWAPYRFKVNPSYLKSGVNKITFDVTNNRANEMDDARLISGLLGPVTLNIYRKQ
ncbi:glycosyl hydrolase [Gracilibacillus timonensis]|uniref:glycosyl hydrolase n=1 Tax=Gracilibacillus timonensis TaxID=1816696 RepID=UPI000AAAB99C|nr:glycosyl hydrolase [Gracilibacillus timonensis]